jgi:hypothetical protein
MSHRNRHRPNFVHRVAVAALTLVGSALLGVVVGATEPNRHDRPHR